MWSPCLNIYQGLFTYKKLGTHKSPGTGTRLLLEYEHKQNASIISWSINSSKKNETRAKQILSV